VSCFCEKLLAEVGESSGTQAKRKAEVRNRYEATTEEESNRLRRPGVYYSDLPSVENSEGMSLLPVASCTGSMNSIINAGTRPYHPTLILLQRTVFILYSYANESV
jgi:hypothetical protein